MDWLPPGRRRRVSNPWWRDPHLVDGYKPEGLPWPVETSRFAYLAPFGGFSEDLDPGTLGLNRQALEENTELRAGDAVTVSVFEGRRPVPLFVRPSFELIPLDFHTPDAYLQSTEGQAVLCQEDTQLDPWGLEEVSEDVRIVLNGVLAARMRDGAGS